MPDEVLAADLGSLDRIGWVAHLATAARLDGPPESWTDILETAIAEKCAALAWLRSGAFIRSHAPSGEVARWRALAVASDARQRAQDGALFDALRALRSAGVEAVVLKGAPLSLRLYGDQRARMTDDVDLFVASRDRAVARGALTETGWRPQYSESMLDDCYLREGTAGTVYLEVHTALVSELLAHVCLVEPTVETVALEGGAVRALSGAALPVHLAAHLAKHPFPSLLWLVDFATLWADLEPEEREAARALASRSRLSRWLSWAVHQASLVEPAAAGDRAALGALGFTSGERRVTHGMREFVRHSDSPLDAARVLGALVWPRHLRRDLPGFFALSARRIRSRLGSNGGRPPMARNR